MDSQHSAIRNFVLPSTSLGASFFIGGKKQGRTNPNSGTGLIDIGTPRLRTQWNIIALNINTEEALKATKTNLKIEGNTKPVILATFVEFLIAGIPVVKTLVNTMQLPEGPAATNSKREAWLTGSVNLPQSIEVPRGQTIYMKMYLELISSGEPITEGEMKVDTSSVPIEAVIVYTQSFGKK